MSSDEGAELEKKVAEPEEATEQRMHSVADLLPGGKRSTSVQTGYPRGQRSTAADLSAVAPTTRKE
jgi:hypothetical protein